MTLEALITTPKRDDAVFFFCQKTVLNQPVKVSLECYDNTVFTYADASPNKTLKLCIVRYKIAKTAFFTVNVSRLTMFNA